MIQTRNLADDNLFGRLRVSVILVDNIIDEFLVFLIADFIN